MVGELTRLVPSRGLGFIRKLPKPLIKDCQTAHFLSPLCGMTTTIVNDKRLVVWRDVAEWKEALRALRRGIRCRLPLVTNHQRASRPSLQFPGGARQRAR